MQGSVQVDHNPSLATLYNFMKNIKTKIEISETEEPLAEVWSEILVESANTCIQIVEGL